MTSSPKVFESIVRHYEECLKRHGDSYRGVDGSSQEGAEASYDVMLGLLRNRPGERVSLLDVGCGLSHLLERIHARGRDDIAYSGLDISDRFIERARAKFPTVQYYCGDILDESFRIPQFDYVVMNGVLTEKVDLSFEAMWDYSQRLIERAFSIARVGLAFNFMSKQVEWERDDLFHVPFDLVAAFVARRLSRHFVFRHDYGLYQYTTYVYRDSACA